MPETAFQSIARVLRTAPPDITFQQVAQQARVSKGAILAYLKQQNLFSGNTPRLIQSTKSD